MRKLKQTKSKKGMTEREIITKHVYVRFQMMGLITFAELFACFVMRGIALPLSASPRLSIIFKQPRSYESCSNIREIEISPGFITRLIDDCVQRLRNNGRAKSKRSREDAETDVKLALLFPRRFLPQHQKRTTNTRRAH